MKRILIIGSLVLIPACLPKKTKQAAFLAKAASSFETLKTNIDIIEPVCSGLELEAKLTDIPLMLGTTLVADRSKTFDTDQTLFTWTCCYDQELIREFYLKEMECAGWRRLMDFHEKETVLIFQKPRNLCVISMRLHASKTLISMIVSPLPEID